VSVLHGVIFLDADMRHTRDSRTDLAWREETVESTWVGSLQSAPCLLHKRIRSAASKYSSAEIQNPTG